MLYNLGACIFTSSTLPSMAAALGQACSSSFGTFVLSGCNATFANYAHAGEDTPCLAEFVLAAALHLAMVVLICTLVD